MNLAFGCRMVVFEWERFGLESFRNDTSVYREREAETTWYNVPKRGNFGKT